MFLLSAPASACRRPSRRISTGTQHCRSVNAVPMSSRRGRQVSANSSCGRQSSNAAQVPACYTCRDVHGSLPPQRMHDPQLPSCQDDNRSSREAIRSPEVCGRASIAAWSENQLTLKSLSLKAPTLSGPPTMMATSTTASAALVRCHMMLKYRPMEHGTCYVLHSRIAKPTFPIGQRSTHLAAHRVPSSRQAADLIARFSIC